MTGGSWLWLCLGLIPFLVEAKPNQRNFRFNIVQFVVKPIDRDLIKEMKCQLSEVELQTAVDFLRPNNPAMRVYNGDLDLCQFFSTLHKNRLLSVVARSLSSGITGSLECPVKANFNYSLTNWHLDENDLPSYVPECEVKALTKFYTQKKLILSIKLVGRVVNKH